MLDKLERKIGKYAIPHLINYLIGGYAIGYLLYFGSRYTSYDFLSFMTLQPYYIIHGFQFWRIITWVMIPPQQNIIFAIIMMIFYYQLGTVLEQTWGTFRFNVFIFGGMFFTVIGAFILYGVYASMGPLFLESALAVGNYFSTYYINLSIFLAFAICYPDMQVMLYFIVPIKMKWLSVIYIVLILIEFVSYGWGGRVAIMASLLNVFLFYLSVQKSKNYRGPKQMFRQAQFKRKANEGARSAAGAFTGAASGKEQPHHKCAICGRTDISHPDLTFRYCSKCKGEFEYCQDHLFTHTHVQ